jgi:hypothetical protein
MSVFVKRPAVLFAALCAFVFFPPTSLAQSQIPFWPQQEESPRPQRETVSWQALVQKLQQRIEKHTAGKDVRISFLNTPYGKYCVEDLMAYTLSGDGAVTIQMHDTMKQITVPPEELYWLGQFLLEQHLADLPEKEPEVSDSAEFRVSVRVESQKRTLRLYNTRNNKDREIIWQYLYSFGLRLLQAAGLLDQNKTFMPVCRGVTEIRELDTNTDGLIDWLKLKIEFTAFKSGDFTLSFGGRTTTIFLAQGNTAQYAYINTYLMQEKDLGLFDYSRLRLDTKPPNPKGPYVMDLKTDTAGYLQRNDLRKTPDLSSKDAEPLRFEARLNQEVILEMTRAGSPADRGVLRFFVKDVQPGRAIIGNDTESITVTAKDPFFLHDIECIGCILTLVKTEGSIAVFEIRWIVPDKEVIASKIQHFNEAFASDNFHGDKEQARQSLDSALSCKEAIENTDDLQVNVVYTTPAQ